EANLLFHSQRWLQGSAVASPRGANCGALMPVYRLLKAQPSTDRLPTMGKLSTITRAAPPDTLLSAPLLLPGRDSPSRGCRTRSALASLRYQRSGASAPGPATARATR